MLERRWTRWLLILSFWALLCVFFASQNKMAGAYRQHPVSWAQAFTFPAVTYGFWALLTPVVLWLARRFPLERRHWLRALLVHVPAAALFSVLHLRLASLVLPYVYAGNVRVASMEIFRSLFLGQFHFNFLVYWAIVGAAHGFAYHRRYRERELRASQLEGRLAQAQLQVLKMQLHPHFLFNTLNSISALVHEDPEAADRMISRLGDLLRLTLESAGAQEVPLRQELDFLQRYIEIEEVRFGERLRVHMDIDPETLDARVPNLILQPLVENAIRHGVAPRAEGGRIEIRARRQGASLCLEVRDDGAGLPATLNEGLGISNTRARLAQLYGAAQRFELANATDGGLVVRLQIPFRLDTAGEDEGTSENTRADRG